MNYEEYESKYLMNLPTFTEVNGVLANLLNNIKEVRLKRVHKSVWSDKTYMDYKSFSIHHEENSFLVCLADDKDPETITDEDLALITDDIIEQKLKTANEIYDKCAQKFKEMYCVINTFRDSIPCFKGDESELLEDCVATTT